MVVVGLERGREGCRGTVGVSKVVLKTYRERKGEELEKLSRMVEMESCRVVEMEGDCEWWWNGNRGELWKVSWLGHCEGGEL